MPSFYNKLGMTGRAVPSFGYTHEDADGYYSMNTLFWYPLGRHFVYFVYTSKDGAELRYSFSGEPVTTDDKPGWLNRLFDSLCDTARTAWEDWVKSGGEGPAYVHDQPYEYEIRLDEYVSDFPVLLDSAEKQIGFREAEALLRNGEEVYHATYRVGGEESLIRHNVAPVVDIEALEALWVTEGYRLLSLVRGEDTTFSYLLQKYTCVIVGTDHDGTPFTLHMLDSKGGDPIVILLQFSPENFEGFAEMVSGVQKRVAGGHTHVNASDMYLP